MGGLIAQSLILGYLTDYFGIENPTPSDTRDAYLYATGMSITIIINVYIVNIMGLLVWAWFMWYTGLLSQISNKAGWLGTNHSSNLVLFFLTLKFCVSVVHQKYVSKKIEYATHMDIIPACWHHELCGIQCCSTLSDIACIRLSNSHVCEQILWPITIMQKCRFSFVVRVSLSCCCCMLGALCT